MWLLDKMLRALIRKGRLVLTDHDGKVYTYGEPAADPLHIRLTDKGAALHIAKDPRIGAGEAYMDGRLVIEPPHDVRDFILFVMSQGSGDKVRPRLAAWAPGQTSHATVGDAGVALTTAVGR